MRYPNLAAEVAATGEDREFAFKCLADAAGVTERLLRHAVWGNECIMATEGYSLYCALTPYGCYEHYSFKYLFCHVLATVQPGTNKTIYRIYTLRRLLEAAEGIAPDHWWTEQRRRARHTLSRMEQGESVAYADYRFGVNLANYIIADRTKLTSHRPLRDVDNARRKGGASHE